MNSNDFEWFLTQHAQTAERVDYLMMYVAVSALREILYEKKVMTREEYKIVLEKMMNLYKERVDKTPKGQYPEARI